MSRCHSREGGNPYLRHSRAGGNPVATRIPLDPRLRGDDEIDGAHRTDAESAEVLVNIKVLLK